MQNMDTKKTSFGKKLKTLAINLLIMAAACGAALWITMAWLDSYTHHGQSTQVPDLSGMTITQAAAELERCGLQGKIIDSTYIKGRPSKTVISHTPEKGQSVKTGRTIYLTINSSETPLKEVPDVANNSSLREAEARLQANGFKLKDIEYVPDEAREWVVGIKYRGRLLGQSEKIPEGSELTLLVGAEGLQLPDSAKIYIDSLLLKEEEQLPAKEEKPDVDASWFN